MSLKDKFITQSYDKNSIKKLKVKSHDDLEFMNSLSAAMLIKSSFKHRALLWVGFILVVWILLWAYFAQIDQLTRGSGKVIPSREIQVVQNLEGGIVTDILVEEGEDVKKGQILVKIDNTSFLSKYDESKLRYIELRAKVARLKAEATGKKIKFNKDFQKANPDVCAREKSLFESNQMQLKNNIYIHKQRLEQKIVELKESKAKIDQLEKTFSLISKEIEINRPLFDEGIVSEIEFLKLQREATSIEGELISLKNSIPRLKAAIEEQKKSVQEVKYTFLNKSKEEYNEVLAQMKRIKRSNIANEDKVTRTLVRSPVDGKVKQLMVNTIGGVVRPGMDIIEIVPTQDTLIIEAKIRPSDIAFLRENQKAIVKFSAYDFAIYGSLDGVLTHISADTIIDDQDKQSYYMVKVKTDKTYLGSDSNKLEIKVGMTADVDIVTGKKTVLDYILKPILRAKQNALSER